MDEVSGPVIAIVLVLAAVFVPVAFLGGITGELYKQFAITIALSVAISGFVALTLSPALCALVLKPGHGSPKGFWKIFNRSFDWVQTRYVETVGIVLKRSIIALAIFGTLVFVILGLFKTIPGSFLPEEDQGYFITIVQLPDGASLTRTIRSFEPGRKLFPIDWSRPFDRYPGGPELCVRHPGNESGNDVHPIAPLGYAEGRK